MIATLTSSTLELDHGRGHIVTISGADIVKVSWTTYPIARVTGNPDQYHLVLQLGGAAREALGDKYEINLSAFTSPATWNDGRTGAELAAEAVSAIAGQSSSGGSSSRTITLTGDVTGTGIDEVETSLSETGVTAGDYTNANISVGSDGRITAAANGSATIENDSVTNAKLANMAQARIKGRADSAGTGDPSDLTPDQVSAILDDATDPFLRTSAAGSGDVVGPASATNNNIALFDGTTGKLLKDASTAISDLATAAQGAKADTALQPADVGTAAAANTGTGSSDVPTITDADARYKPVQVTGLTLTDSSWSLVSGLYEYDLANANITASSIVEVIPDNADIDIVIAAGVLPRTDSSAGSVKLYAVNAPSDDIGVTINIHFL